jgi:aldehyde dehydrogenase (NAD+)
MQTIDVSELFAKGKAEGARLVAGGGRPAGRTRGWFVEPTIFADVDNRQTIAREEIFGPVLAVIPYDGVDEAVAIANDSDFGLARELGPEGLAAYLEIQSIYRPAAQG